ncbi:MAG TPA: hypothetical protein VH092_23855 [Urbifossiella sp.]|jgi:hypothetical protein|nr:hypothetical protein [Urbifossiella sp.]
MDDELTPEQQFAAEDPGTMGPRALMQGRHPDEIVAEMVRLDWSPQAARAFVARVEDDLCRFDDSPESRARLVREAQSQVAAGLLFALVGVVLTVLAMRSGWLACFVTMFGLFGVGLTVAGRGWTRWRLYRRASLPFPPAGPEDASPAEPRAAPGRGPGSDPGSDSE